MALLPLALGACSQSSDEALAEIREMQAQGRLEESVDVLRTMINDGNREAEVLYRYGRALSVTGEPGRGMWALDSALGDPEWFVRASHQLASDAYSARNYELAIEILKRLAEEREDDPEEDIAARMLELRARVELRNQYEEALILADEIIETHPDEEEAVRLKAVCLLGLKMADEAYELIREAGILSNSLGGSESGSDGLDGESEGSDELALGKDERVEAYWCLVRATFKREAKQIDEAKTVINDCLEAHPTDLALVSEALRLYGQVRDYERVDSIMKAAYEADPLNSEMRIAWVRQLDVTGRVDEAEAILQQTIEDAKAIETRPDRPNARLASAWVDLGAFLVDHGRAQEGLLAYDKAIEILGDLAAPPLLFRHAEGLILGGRYDDALAIADRTPIEVHVPMIRGRVAFERGDYKGAIKELQAAARVWPDNSPIRYYLARAYEGVGDFDAAIEEYRQAIRADAALTAARERLSRLHLAESRVRHALTILRFTTPIMESKSSGVMKLLDIEAGARLGQEPDLTIPPSTDMSLDELRRGAVAALSRGLRAANGWEAAEETLTELLEHVADAPSRGYFNRERVGLLLEEGRVDEAVSIARKASREPYATADVAVALARALIAEGQNLDEARGLLDRIISIMPEDLDALTAYGDLEQLLGEPVAALVQYERALEVDPGHWPALEKIVAHLSKNGKTDEATLRLAAYVNRDNPYHGLAALELAKRIPSAEHERQIELAERAIRFGAGTPAIDWLESIDPEAAVKYRAMEEANAASEKDAPST